MKATIEIPDDLYRLVKAKSALEGRAVREVTVDLYQRYVGQELPGETEVDAQVRGGRAIPSWFGVLRQTSRPGVSNDMNAIRESIARGIARDRDL